MRANARNEANKQCLRVLISSQAPGTPHPDAHAQSCTRTNTAKRDVATKNTANTQTARRSTISLRASKKAKRVNQPPPPLSHTPTHKNPVSARPFVVRTTARIVKKQKQTHKQSGVPTTFISALVTPKVHSNRKTTATTTGTRRAQRFFFLSPAPHLHSHRSDLVLSVLRQVPNPRQRFVVALLGHLEVPHLKARNRKIRQLKLNANRALRYCVRIRCAN